MTRIKLMVILMVAPIIIALISWAIIVNI